MQSDSFIINYSLQLLALPLRVSTLGTRLLHLATLDSKPLQFLKCLEELIVLTEHSAIYFLHLLPSSLSYFMLSALHLRFYLPVDLQIHLPCDIHDLFLSLIVGE